MKAVPKLVFSFFVKFGIHHKRNEITSILYAVKVPYSFKV